MATNTILNEAIIEFEERKSKFIGYIKPVTSVAQAEQFIESIKAKHPTATHNIPLYRVLADGQEYLKYNDDGEPSGTAGKPMADIAIIKEVYDFALVATRYFGGIKLGAGGLIRMYAKVAKLAFDAAEIVCPIPRAQFKIIHSYDMTAKVNEFLHNDKITVLAEQYGENVEIIIEVNEADKNIVDLYGVNIIAIP